jgi:hypothetical protein
MRVYLIGCRAIRFFTTSLTATSYARIKANKPVSFFHSASLTRAAAYGEVSNVPRETASGFNSYLL